MVGSGRYSRRILWRDFCLLNGDEQKVLTRCFGSKAVQERMDGVRVAGGRLEAFAFVEAAALAPSFGMDHSGCLAPSLDTIVWSNLGRFDEEVQAEAERGGWLPRGILAVPVVASAGRASAEKVPRASALKGERGDEEGLVPKIGRDSARKRARVGGFADPTGEEVPWRMPWTSSRVWRRLLRGWLGPRIRYRLAPQRV